MNEPAALRESTSEDDHGWTLSAGDEAGPARHAHLPVPSPDEDEEEEDPVRRGPGGGNIDPDDDDDGDEDDEEDEDDDDGLVLVRGALNAPAAVIVAARLRRAPSPVALVAVQWRAISARPLARVHLQSL